MKRISKSPVKPKRKYKKRAPKVHPTAHEVTASDLMPAEQSFQDSLTALIQLHLRRVNPKTTLLCDPRHLPKCRQKRGPLSMIYSLDRDDYARMLAVIMRGASVQIAATYTGIDPTTFVNWKRQGLEDLRFKKDTHFARFVNDINFAATIATIEAETDVHDANPLEWLRTGPGRWVHPEGTWQQARDSQPSPVEIPETTGLAISGPDQEDESDDMDLMSTAPTAGDLPEALIALHQVGLGHVIEQAQEEAKKRNESHADRITEEGSRNTPPSGHSPGTPGTNGKVAG